MRATLGPGTQLVSSIIFIGLIKFPPEKQTSFTLASRHTAWIATYVYRQLVT